MGGTVGIGRYYQIQKISGGGLLPPLLKIKYIKPNAQYGILHGLGVMFEWAGLPPLRFALCSLYKATPRRDGLLFGIEGPDVVRHYNPYLAPLSVVVSKVFMCGGKTGPVSFARYSNISAVLGGERLD